jgi:hypothetical protein
MLCTSIGVNSKIWDIFRLGIHYVSVDKWVYIYCGGTTRDCHGVRHCLCLNSYIIVLLTFMIENRHKLLQPLQYEYGLSLCSSFIIHWTRVDSSGITITYSGTLCLRAAHGSVLSSSPLLISTRLLCQTVIVPFAFRYVQIVPSSRKVLIHDI